MKRPVIIAAALAAAISLSVGGVAVGITDTTTTEPPTTAEATTSPSTPTTQEQPTTTETAATPTTDAPTTTASPSTSDSSTSSTTPDDASSPAPIPSTGTTTPSDDSSSPTARRSSSTAEPTEDEIVEAIVAILAAYIAEPLTVETTTTLPSDKVFVCKYKTTPGEGESLQTGDNPISVSISSLTNGPIAVGSSFSDGQNRSLVIAFDIGQPEPDVSVCPPPGGGTTTTTSSTSSTTSSTTTTSSTSTTTSTTSTTEVPTTTTSSTTTTEGPTTTTSSTTTTLPTPGLFAIEVSPLCPDGTTPEIEITFGDRPDLDGQVGTLTFSTGGSMPLTFDSLATVTIPYPASAGTGPVTMTYTLGAESVTRETTFPDACDVSTTTTSSSIPGPTTTSSTTSTTTSSTSTTLPATFEFGAAASVCVAEVPTIRINFLNTFPELAGQTGTLTMSDINGNVVSTQSLVYAPGTTVDLLYPGTAVNADGSIDDVPGWILTDDGFWIRDPSDEFLREGIVLTYTVNPTATATVEYPPESSTCANPDGPFPPGPTTTLPGVVTPPPGVLPPTA